MTHTIKDITWPGPKPISFSGDEEDWARAALAGRDEEMIELRRACQAYGVVELTAPSGVGKTSFLEGARVYLETEGFNVVKALGWSDAIAEYERLDGAAAAERALPLYCLALRLPICDDLEALSAAVRKIDADAPLVFVFDQVEELLRYEQDLGAGLLELIGQVAAATWVPHVVAARTEFRDRLRPVEVQDAPTWHMLLSELSERKVIGEVIEGPVPPGVVLEDGVVKQIIEWWEAARSPSRRPGWRDGAGLAASQCGLLHLQALLWDLQEWAVSSAAPEKPQVLTLETLRRYAKRDGGGARDGAQLIADALCGYIEVSVAGYKSPSWPVGPRLMLARAAGHLSSAGFKVAQPASALAARAIQEELGSSKSGQEGQEGFDLDSKAGREQAAAFFVSRFQIDAAGVARGWTREEVAEEMVAALEGVLSWLAGPKGPNVLRSYSHGGDSIYELVHDGVAPALDRWAEGVLEDPIALLGGICVRRGEIFDHDLGLGTFLDAEGKIKPYWSGVEVRQLDGRRAVAVEDIRWHGLGVHHPDKAEADGAPDPVTIEDVVFEDCDFTGTLFKGVVFRNVRFERCEMRGVAMLGCCFENVVFDRSRMPGAAINQGRFEGVCFDCAGVEGAMNYVSVEKAKPGAEVTIRNLENTAGLFLVGLTGGTWALEEVELSHLTFEGTGDLELRLGPRCRLGHAKLGLPVNSAKVDRREKVEIVYLTDDTSIIPPDALGDGPATSG